MPSPHPHLSNDDVERYRETLQKMESVLIGEVNDLRKDALDASAEIDTSRLPENDVENAAASLEQDLAFTFWESEELVLIMVRDALQRIEAGIYGMCLISQEPIKVARLDFLPYAKYTIEIQRKIDSGEVDPNDY